MTNEERNAILETLRYCDQQQAARASLTSQAQQQEEDASGGRKDAENSTRPLTQCASAHEACLLFSLFLL